MCVKDKSILHKIVFIFLGKFKIVVLISANEIMLISLIYYQLGLWLKQQSLENKVNKNIERAIKKFRSFSCLFVCKTLYKKALFKKLIR